MTLKKLFVCKVFLSFVALGYQVLSVKQVSANTIITTSTVDNYIKQVYGQIDFSGSAILSQEVFKRAYKGYLNLQNAGKINRAKNILTVVDFSLSSTKKRMWVIDLENKKILINDYVAHGQGSGKEYATVFSNIENSHQSSIGFYVTGDIYMGDHGASLKLHGMDNGYNSAAYDRAIVIHGADYVCTDLIKSQNYIGRSWGCPAVSNQVVSRLINTVNDGTCLFIYAPNKKYLAKAYWLNKKLDYLPEQMISDNIMFAVNTTKKDTDFVYDVSAADLVAQKLTGIAANSSFIGPMPLAPSFFPIWKLLQ